MDLAAIENGGAARVNKIDVYLNVAVETILAPVVDAQRILPTEKAAVFEARPIGLDVKLKREGLDVLLAVGCVLEGDVFGGEIGGLHEHRGAVADADFFPFASTVPTLVSCVMTVALSSFASQRRVMNGFSAGTKRCS
jgi:hypothetical protein